MKTSKNTLIVGLLVAGVLVIAGFGNAENMFNQPGNILIADQFNNRVIEIDRDHNIVWHFGNGSPVAGPHSIVGTNDAQRVGSFTLISGTGTPAGADPSCPDMVNGCPDNRVILVNWKGEIVWQYGQTGITGSGPDQSDHRGHAVRDRRFHLCHHEPPE
jgi:hypothetical protein